MTIPEDEFLRLYDGMLTEETMRKVFKAARGVFEEHFKDREDLEGYDLDGFALLSLIHCFGFTSCEMDQQDFIKSMIRGDFRRLAVEGAKLIPCDCPKCSADREKAKETAKSFIDRITGRAGK